MVQFVEPTLVTGKLCFIERWEGLLRCVCVWAVHWAVSTVAITTNEKTGRGSPRTVNR